MRQPKVLKDGERTFLGWLPCATFVLVSQMMSASGSDALGVDRVGFTRSNPTRTP